MDQQVQATLQALLRGLQTGGAYSGVAAPHSATSVAPRPQVPPQQVRLPASSAPLPQAETYSTTSYDPSAGYMRGLDSTYGSVTVPYTTTTASSSTMAAASGSGGITTTSVSSYPTYTPLDTVVAGSDNVTNLANMPLPDGSSPIVDASRAMESPGYIQTFGLGTLNTSGLGSTLSTPTSSLNTPTHARRVPADDVGEIIRVDNNGSRPPSGNGNNNGNDNI